MEGGFHGRTYAALTATAQPKYHAGFEPMVPGLLYVPYDDLDAVAAAFDDQTAAVLVEPIQGEGGINIPAPGYLAGLRQLCDEQGVLLILDEVQTGMGRTGKWFAYQHSSIEPDILTCAKALAGGVAAGVMMAQPDVAAHAQAGDARLHLRRQPDRLPRRAGDRSRRSRKTACSSAARAIGERFRAHFERLRAELPELIRDIRILGVMIGLDLTFDAAAVVAECLRTQLLINATHGHVVRLLPALTITDEQIDEGCAILAEVIRRV